MTTTAEATTCRHVEHRHDRQTDRRIGFDVRLNEWQPCERKECPAPAE